MDCAVLSFYKFRSVHWAHGVVVSHLLSMREALGSIPSVSIFPRQNTLQSETWLLPVCLGHLPVCGLPACPSVCLLLLTCLSAFLPACLPLCLPAYLSACLQVCPPLAWMFESRRRYSPAACLSCCTMWACLAAIPCCLQQEGEGCCHRHNAMCCCGMASKSALFLQF